MAYLVKVTNLPAWVIRPCMVRCLEGVMSRYCTRSIHGASPGAPNAAVNPPKTRTSRSVTRAGQSGFGVYQRARSAPSIQAWKTRWMGAL